MPSARGVACSASLARRLAKADSTYGATCAALLLFSLEFIMTHQTRIIIGISGASGIIYGIRLLEILRELAIESHLVVTKMADLTRAHETNLSATELRQLAYKTYSIADMSAAIASGSFQVSGMIIAPCSMKTLAEIASGVTSNLLTRAADVTLKERRKLVLLVRESPLHRGHLQNMLAVTEMGAIVAPPVPAFYIRPESLHDIIDHTAGRALDLLNVDCGLVKRWGE
jgi:4-hydroxy-3-polyprenylbenzoate decarboxylase